MRSRAYKGKYGIKISVKFVNNTLVEHLRKCGFFSDFQYGFKSFQSATDLLQLCLIKLLGILIDLDLLKQLIYATLSTVFDILVF